MYGIKAPNRGFVHTIPNKIRYEILLLKFKHLIKIIKKHLKTTFMPRKHKQLL
jgi:hypothetical protein